MASCLPCGRAEPAPPRCGPSQLGWPCEGGPGSGAKGGFSEGRTLCVRIERPHECRGISFAPDDEARGLWPTGDMSGPGRCLPCGRAEPAPPRSRPSELRWPPGARPGDGVKGGFLGGTHSVRPHGMALRLARPRVATGALTISLWLKGGEIWGGVMPSLRACGARPSAGAGPARMALQGKLGDDAKGGFLGGTHSVRPHGKAAREQRHSISTRR